MKDKPIIKHISRNEIDQVLKKDQKKWSKVKLKIK